jgi:NAD(P)-dependent dehydrogenase (short-subunit alcohol dehydrogenase family)
MEQLSGRVAVVTGGASGIGRGMIEAFAEEGMKLVLADIEAEPLANAVSEVRSAGAEAIGVECDVSDAGSVEALRDRALTEYGKIHVLCNNAGVSGSGVGATWELPQEEWDWVMGVNLNGVVFGHRSFIPAMIEQGEGGHIVNTASMAGVIPGQGIYGVTKHAVVALSESLFREFATRGVDLGVSVLCPGWVRTRILESERNRPEMPRVDPGEAAPMIEMFKNIITGLVEKGREPVEVGRLVADSIKQRRFYVLTHPTWKNMIRHRVDNILEDRDPTSVPPDGDPADWSDALG